MTKTKKRSRNRAKAYYKRVDKRGTIYVWGMNYPTKITKESIEEAYRDCGTEKYNKAYYANKLNEGKGKPGSDCSGMHYAISGTDTTANGYYHNHCTETGKMDTLPINDIVVLFRGYYETKTEKKPDGTIEKTEVFVANHTGTYYGNGLCIHMKSSKDNCVTESVDNHNWTEWGRPDFIDYSTSFKKSKPVFTRTMKKGDKGVDVKFLQLLLADKGYSCGQIDGIFGDMTREAVLKFQKSKNITADGVVFEVTAKKLGFNCTWYKKG
jgi:hypothetical protein